MPSAIGGLTPEYRGADIRCGLNERLGCGRSGHSGGQPERPEVSRRADNADVRRDCVKGTKLEMLSWRLPAVHRIVHQTNLSRIVLGDRCLDPILPSHES